MSAAATTEPPKQDPSVPPQGFKPVTMDLQAVLKSASNKAAMGRSNWKPLAEKPAEISKELEKVAETTKPAEEKKPPTEEKKEEVKPPVVEEKKPEDPPIKHNAEHFRVVTEARDAALARQKELELELEKLRTTPPPEIATKLSDYEKQLEQLRKSEGELREKVRAVDVTLDPKFNEEYTQPVLKSQQSVLELLIRGGATKEDAEAAVGAWSDDKFSEVTASMPEIQKRRVDAAILETERLAKVRAEQIKSPDDYQARRRQQDEELQKRAFTERERTANEIFTGLIESTPALKGDEYKPLRDSVTQQLARASKGEIGVKELMGKIAQAEVLTIALQGQHAALEEQAKEIEALKKERDDLNAFVKANGGSTLKTETAAAEEGGKPKGIWDRIVVKPPV